LLQHSTMGLDQFLKVQDQKLVAAMYEVYDGIQLVNDFIIVVNSFLSYKT